MGSPSLDAVVVGAGPNGLAAAITLARAGRSVHVVEGAATVGGGCRTAEVTRPGFRHDVCSAIHPLAAGSPFLAGLPLAELGVELVHPDLPVAHPLDGGRAGALHRDLDETAAAMGADGDRWRRLLGPLVARWDRIGPQLLGPLTRPPRHPLAMARFGLPAVRSARSLARRFDTDEVRGLFAGCAGHAFLPLDAPLTASFGLVLAALAHVVGWPIVRGGSQVLADALAAHLRSLGGEIETGRWVTSLDELPPSRAVLLDVTPQQLTALAGDRLPVAARRRAGRFRPGPGVCKVDYALSGPVPWQAETCRRAGTVHVGGTFEEVAAAEADVAAGRHADRPFVLVAQQSLFDDSRAPAGHHTLWAYCHVPTGSTLDRSDAIDAQIERFAPGFRDLVVERHVTTAAGYEAYNPSFRGGDISAGSHGGLQLLLRPWPKANPYATAVPDVYLCSGSTPPGGGVHGMCGHHAASAALRRSLR